MTPQQLAELAEKAANKINKLTNLDSYAFSNQDVNDMNDYNFKDGFIKGYEANKWISVEQQKPTFGEEVLVFCEIYGRYIAQYIFIGEFGGVDYGNWHDGKSLGVLPPKFWQALPPKP